MLIHDRRRCRPLQVPEQRKRLTKAQRMRLDVLESDGWRMAFVRGEAASAFVSHGLHGHGIIVRDGRLVALDALPLRQDDVGVHTLVPLPARGRPQYEYERAPGP